MKHVLAAFAFACLFLSNAVFAQEKKIEDLPWVTGPTKGQIGANASIQVPEGYAFLGPDGAKEFNRITENPESGIDEYILAKQDLSWKRPTEQSVKSSLSHAMKTVLADPIEPEDVKAKRHRQHLTRFLQTKRKLVEEPPVGEIKADDLIDFGPTVD